MSICLSVFFLALLALGAFGVSRIAWILTGKDVIEANSDVLRVSRQTFIRKSLKEYSADNIKDLRFVKQARFVPFRSIRRLVGSNGMIAFDYGAKTFQFGSELEEAEAKHIILTLQEGLHPQNAG